MKFRIALLSAMLAASFYADAQLRRSPEERIDLPGAWRCVTPRGTVGTLSVTAQGDFALNGSSSRYTLQGNTLTAVNGTVTTQYRVRQAGNALTMVGADGRHSCQRGGSGPLT